MGGALKRRLTVRLAGDSTVEWGSVVVRLHIPGFGGFILPEKLERAVEAILPEVAVEIDPLTGLVKVLGSQPQVVYASFLVAGHHARPPQDTQRPGDGGQGDAEGAG